MAVDEKLLRQLPSIDELLKSPALKEAISGYSASLVTEAARVAVGRAREEILAGSERGAGVEELAASAMTWIETTLSPSLKRVINATGTLLHTNLGRAVLSHSAVEALIEAATGEVNIEYDLTRGKRGERDSLIEDLIKRLTGAEAACVVNNNAAAVLIVLNTLADGKEVIISRGELIEIGGSFRLPDIIEKSGCRLKEVGTTNRTHLKDYEGAVSTETALILKAHTSNYRVVGFTSDVSLSELTSVGKEKGVPVVEDLGSGALVDMTRFGLGGNLKEPLVGDSIEAGVSIVTFSGDKLLGGPQAGIIAGKKEYIDAVKKNPLKRALRVDKLTMAALEATLKLYLNEEKLAKELPTLAVLTRPIEEIEEAAFSAKGLLIKALGEGYAIEIADGFSEVGSGSLPEEELSTKVVTVTHPDKKPDEIFSLFLNADPPIIGRVYKDAFTLDMRAIISPELIVPKATGG